jgi:hypothetical protein
VLLDRLGWDVTIEEVDGLFGFVFDEAARAKLRIAKTGEEPIRVVIGLAVFEAPQDLRKVP